jgi:hypothetical protein
MHAALGLDVVTIDALNIFLKEVDCLVLLKGAFLQTIRCIGYHTINEILI